MGLLFQKPYEREYRGEGYETLADQLALQPGWAQGERQWRPYWAGTSQAELQASVFGTGDAPGALGMGNRAARNTLRNIEQWSPNTYGLLNAMGAQAGAENQNPYALSSAEVREITQASMANPALASLGAQPRDAYLAYTNLGQAAVQRAQQRRGFGQQVMADEQQYRVNPALQARNQVYNYGMQLRPGPTTLDPWSAASQDVFNTNYNAEAAVKAARSNFMQSLVQSGQQSASDY